MKFLVAGLGSIGRRHLRNLVALGEMDIILYRTRRSTLPEDELAPYPTFGDLDTALAQKPDAVIISNPTSLHMDIAIPAARAGCHLFIEKPVSDTFEKIPELEKSLAIGGGKVLVGFQFRFHPGLQKIKELLDRHSAGEPVFVRAHWGEYLPGWHPWENYRHGYAARADLGGGVVRTLCHPLDYLQWLFGEIKTVSATINNSKLLGIDVEEIAEVSVQFSSGLIGSVHLNYLQRPARHDMEIITTNGTIRWDNNTGEVTVNMAEPVQKKYEYPAPKGFERNYLFISQMKHFLDLIQDRAASLCPLHDGIMTQHVVDSVYQSAFENKPINVFHIKLG